MADARYGSLQFREQIEFFLGKLSLPTATWRDIWQSAHDRAFVVAGAMKADLIDDLRMAVQKGIDQGTTLEEFRRDFEVIVKHHGWTGWTGEGTKAGRAWRTRVIYETNLRTSYAAGRHAQLKAAGFPYLRYKHNDNVMVPRPHHLALDGKIFRADDPFWRSAAPPNGFGCQCWVEGVSEREMKRLGKAGPDTPPADWTADEGWNYAPGASVADDINRLIAAKTGKWPAQIGKDFMQAAVNVPEAPAAPAPWTILEGGQATLDEIKRLGGERLDELLAMVTPNDRLRDEEKGRVLRDILDDTKIPSRDVAAWFREQVLTRAREVRAIGGVAPELLNKSGKGKDLMQRVASKLPDDWVEAGNAAGPLRVKVNENGRGYFNARKAVDVGKYERFIQTDTGSTAEHEFIHHLQYAMPRLDALFQEEHRRRTSSEPLEWLGGNYAKSEKGRKDGYVEMYQGKEYEPTATHGPALEVITMAYQALLGEDGQASLWLRDMLRKDRDMVSLAIGALFHFRP